MAEIGEEVGEESDVLRGICDYCGANVLNETPFIVDGLTYHSHCVLKAAVENVSIGIPRTGIE